MYTLIICSSATDRLSSIVTVPKISESINLNIGNILGGYVVGTFLGEPTNISDHIPMYEVTSREDLYEQFGGLLNFEEMKASDPDGVEDFLTELFGEAPLVEKMRLKILEQIKNNRCQTRDMLSYFIISSEEQIYLELTKEELIGINDKLFDGKAANQYGVVSAQSLRAHAIVMNGKVDIDKAPTV